MEQGGNVSSDRRFQRFYGWWSEERAFIGGLCRFAIGLVVVAIYSSDELFMHRLSGEVNFRVRNFTSRDSSLWTSFPNEGVSASFSFHPATRAISALPQGRLRPWDLTVYTS